MFAGCVDMTASQSLDNLELGNQLIAQAQERGLAGIPFDEQAVWLQDGVTLIQQRQWHTPESRLEKGVMGDDFSRVLFWGRIDNREELIASLDDTADYKLVKTDTGLVLNAWKRWGPDCCEQMVGDFAFVIYQPRGNHVFLARDHFGVKPLYFHRTAERLVFATSLAVLAELKQLELKPARKWMVRYILGISPDWRRTAYESVEKVQPAHSLFWSPAEPDLPQEAWYRFKSPPPLQLQSEGAYVRVYRDFFDRAVKDRLRSTSAIGAECSGGLDSSAICASVSRQMSAAMKLDPDKNLGLFSMALHRDEPAAIRQVAESVKHQFLYVMGESETEPAESELGDSAWQEHLEVAGFPSEHGNAIAQIPFYREASKNNTGVILSGFGGDEFATTYATTALVDFWQQGRWGLWASRFRGNWLGSKLRMIKWLYRYLRYGPGTETAHRLLELAKNTWSLSPLADEIIWSELQNEFEQGFRYDAGAKSLNEFVLHDRLSPMIGARLESCTLMAARYGIEYRWPMLDIRLVEFFLAVPAEQKLGKGGVGRYLHRRAIADL
ncbi:MAG: asparagine synthase-related protein, partial [Pseudomonadales bacterium]